MITDFCWIYATFYGEMVDFIYHRAQHLGVGCLQVDTKFDLPHGNMNPPKICIFSKLHRKYYVCNRNFTFSFGQVGLRILFISLNSHVNGGQYLMLVSFPFLYIHVTY